MLRCRQPKNFQELRAELDNVISILEYEAQKQALQQLSRKLKHSIEVLDWPGDPKLCTCGMYVFEFQKWGRYYEFAEQDILADSQFYTWAIKNHHLKIISNQNAPVGSLVNYCKTEFPYPGWKHVAILIAADRVESKWGKGILCRHSLWEVPNSYGAAVDFFEPLDHDFAQRIFEQYVHEEWPQYVWPSPN
jgi:hypothetical protein